MSDYTKFLDIKNFVDNSSVNDNSGITNSGLLRLNRFIGIMDKKTFTNSADVTKNDDFLVWNLFKVSCPSLKIGVVTKEVDAIPRYYFKTWEYDDLSISYLESANMIIRHYFYSWMSFALNARTFERHYYDDVKANQFIIYPLGNNGESDMIEVFHDIVPISIDSVDFDVSDDGNAVALTTVKFKYIGHEVLKNVNN
jgi:hypothetical protein